MKTIQKKLFKILLSTTIFLILAILCKENKKYHDKIHYHLYEESFNFNSIYNFYNKYLGGIDFYINKENITPVLYERITYNKLEEYKDGIKLQTSNKYLVPNLKEGIITKIETKKDYNQTIVVKTKNNINIWYGNICNPTLKIYDSIKKGEYLGESCSNYIYIVYEKEGKYLNYKDYFKN